MLPRTALIFAMAMLLAGGCGIGRKVYSREKPPPPQIDERLIGTWRPDVLNGEPLPETDAARSFLVVRGDGIATLLVRREMSQYTRYQKFETSGDALTIRNLTSRNSIATTYAVDGDTLTIGDGPSRQQYTRLGDLKAAKSLVK